MESYRLRFGPSVQVSAPRIFLFSDLHLSFIFCLSDLQLLRFPNWTPSVPGEEDEQNMLLDIHIHGPESALAMEMAHLKCHSTHVSEPTLSAPDLPPLATALNPSKRL